MTAANAMQPLPVDQQITRRSGYSLEEDLMPIMRGKVDVPNFIEVPLSEGVANIAASGGALAQPDVMNAKLPNDDSSWGHWARYFLNRTQGGDFDGTGYVMFYQSTRGVATGRIGHFAICQHKKGDRSDANHNRGWHPGHCEKCGLNMTVDSSD